MGTRYMVSVVRIEDVDVSEFGTRDTVLFEATHQDPARLARFAPEEVLSALVETPMPWAHGDRFKIPGSFGDASAQVPENTVTVSIEPAGPRPAEDDDRDDVADAVAIAGEAPKRKRRSKEEIAADKAAQELGYRDRFHRAEEERKQTQHAGVAPEGGLVEPVAAGSAPPAQSETAVAELFGPPRVAQDANVFAGGGASQSIIAEGAGGFDPFA